MTGRTSMDPPVSLIGQSWVKATASSRDFALSITKPAMASLVSAKGPSVTGPSCETTAPPASRGSPPLWMPLSGKLFIQALQRITTPCIYSGDKPDEVASPPWNNNR